MRLAPRSSARVRVATRFSRTVSVGKICRISGTRPMPACAMRYDGQPADRMAVELDAARVRAQHAEQALHGRRLAHAVAADQRDAFAARGLEGHAEQHLARAVARGEVGDLEQGRHATISWSPEIRCPHFRVLADRRRVAARDHAPIHEHRDAIGELEYGVHVVLDEQDRRSGPSASTAARPCARIRRGSCPPSARRAASSFGRVASVIATSSCRRSPCASAATGDVGFDRESDFAQRFARPLDEVALGDERSPETRSCVPHAPARRA